MVKITLLFFIKFCWLYVKIFFFDIPTALEVKMEKRWKLSFKKYKQAEGRVNEGNSVV